MKGGPGLIFSRSPGRYQAGTGEVGMRQAIDKGENRVAVLEQCSVKRAIHVAWVLKGGAVNEDGGGLTGVGMTK